MTTEGVIAWDDRHNNSLRFCLANGQARCVTQIGLHHSRHGLHNRLSRGIQVNPGSIRKLPSNGDVRCARV